MKRLYDAFKQLKNDNDFSVCGRADDANTRDPALLEQSNKYAAVVVGSYKIQDLTSVLSRKRPSSSPSRGTRASGWHLCI